MTHGSTNGSTKGCFPASVDALCIALPFALSKDILLNLAGRGLRQVLEFDCRWTLEVSHPRPAVLDDLFRGGLSARFCSHESLWHFPPLLIGNRDHRALKHGRVGRDGLFDFDRADVLAAGDNDVLLPIAELDRPVRVHHGHVAAVEPATGKGPGRQL